MREVVSIAAIGPNNSKAHQWATRIVFMLAGLFLAAWAPLIPFVKTRLQISDGRLGMLLLCSGVGGTLAMPFAGAFAGRFGCRRVVVVSSLLAFCTLPIMASAATVRLLAVALVCFGATLGTMDTTMNIHAVLVEKEAARPMMSGFHGLWSVGCIAGAGAVGLMVSAGSSPFLASIIISVLSAITLIATSQALIPYGQDRKGPAFAVPHGKVILLGCFCFVLYLAEGTAIDWSAVFLNTVRGVPIAHAGVAFVVFSTAMTVCRLIGDPVVRLVGPARIVFFGCAVAAAGLFLAIFVPSVVVTVAGYGLLGIGASNVVPVLFSAAGRQASMPAHLALPAMTTLGYAGNLAGPAVVGFVANSFGLTTGLAVVATMLASVAVLSTQAKP